MNNAKSQPPIQQLPMAQILKSCGGSLKELLVTWTLVHPGGEKSGGTAPGVFDLAVSMVEMMTVSCSFWNSCSLGPFAFWNWFTVKNTLFEEDFTAIDPGHTRLHSWRMGWTMLKPPTAQIKTASDIGLVLQSRALVCWSAQENFLHVLWSSWLSWFPLEDFEQICTPSCRGTSKIIFKKNSWAMTNDNDS